MMEYKGYFGSVRYSQEDGVLNGKLEGIRTLISYEATDAAGLEAAFKEAVDEYLADCEADGVAPETPYRGRFSVRVRDSLHRKLVVAAEREGVSLNALVSSALERLYG